MDVEELLNEIRGGYLQSFEKALTQVRGEHPECLVEPFLNDEDGMTPIADPFHVPMRQDLVPLKDGEIASVVVVDSSTVVQFEQVGLEYGNELSLGLGPIVWNQCIVVAAGMGPNPDLSPLIDWFKHWSDIASESEPREDGISEVVHHISRVEAEAENAVGFIVDFGTAPVQALLDLLSVFESMGASVVTVGDFDLEDDAN